MQSASVRGGNAGVLALARGNNDDAVRDLSGALDTGDLSTHAQAAAHNDRGIAYYNKGEYDKAIADYDTAIRLDAQMGPAYNNRGHAYGAKGEYDKATSDFDTAIHLIPRSAPVHFSRGRVMFVKGNYDDAALDFQLTLNIDPKNDFAVLLLHLSQAKSGHDDAAEFRSNAAKIDLATWPGSIVALYLGQATSAQVMADAAKEDARARQTIKSARLTSILANTR